MADIKKIKIGEDTYDIRDNTKLPKLTNEWVFEYNAPGDAGYLLIGSFPMYDSNLTINIDSTTSTTYHGTVVIATQNVSTTSIGTAHTINVYDDPTGTISSALRVVWTSGSNHYKVYFVPSTWSKNFIHIRGMGTGMEGATNMNVFTKGTAPATTSGLTINNVLQSTFAASSHGHGNMDPYGCLRDASVVVVTDANKKISPSSITTTELGYLDGVSSNIQTQLNGKTTLAEVEDYIEDNSEEVDLSTYFTKSDVAALFEELFEFSGTTLIIKDQ